MEIFLLTKGPKMTMTKLSDPERDQAAQIVALFSVLIHAWHTNDFHEAARTRDELERYGIRVKLSRRPGGKGVDNAN